MSKERVRVTTREDEASDFFIGLFLVGLVLLACIGVSIGVLKAIGIGMKTEIGIPSGFAIWVALVFKFKWMRDVILDAISIIAFFAAIFAVFVLLVWAFN